MVKKTTTQLILVVIAEQKKIIALANNIASGSLDENEVSKEQLFKPLADIFNAFKRKRSLVIRSLKS